MAFGAQVVVLWIITAFMLLGAAGRVAMQFWITRPAPKTKKRELFETLHEASEQFEEGFKAFAPLSLAMVGVLSLSANLRSVLSPIFSPVLRVVGASPATFVASILAIDMGGYYIARDMAVNPDGTIDYPSWYYAGLLLASMMGATLSFSIPVGFAMVQEADQPFLARGMLAGISTIPVGCVVGGLVARATDVRDPTGTRVLFPMRVLLVNQIPIAILGGVIILGLLLKPRGMIVGFVWYARGLTALITFGLAVNVLQTLTGVEVIPNMVPMFPVEGDVPGVDLRSMEVVCRIAIVLLGAYPMAHFLCKWCQRPLGYIADQIGINTVAAGGLIATLANNIPAFQLVHEMDDRGKVLNAAWAVSAAFTIGDHLGFIAAAKPDMILPVVVGKLTAGVAAVAVALLFAPERTPLPELNAQKGANGAQPRWAKVQATMAVLSLGTQHQNRPRDETDDGETLPLLEDHADQ